MTGATLSGNPERLMTLVVQTLLVHPVQRAA